MFLKILNENFITDYITDLWNQGGYAMRDWWNRKIALPTSKSIIDYETKVINGRTSGKSNDAIRPDTFEGSVNRLIPLGFHQDIRDGLLKHHIGAKEEIRAYDTLKRNKANEYLERQKIADAQKAMNDKINQRVNSYSDHIIKTGFMPKNLSGNPNDSLTKATLTKTRNKQMAMYR